MAQYPTIYGNDDKNEDQTNSLEEDTTVDKNEDKTSSVEEAPTEDTAVKESRTPSQ